MRILIFTPQIYLLGGAERLAVELAEELNTRAGVRADILSMVPETFAGTEEAVRRLKDNGVPSVQFLGRAPRGSSRGFLSAVRRFRQILIEGKYDVVDTTLLGPCTIACWGVRGLSTPHFSGIHSAFERSRHNSISHRFWRYSCKNSPTLFYAISQSVARHWAEYSRIPTSRVRVIYNSIHSSHFEAHGNRSEVIRELELDPKRRILLFAGRLGLLKGLDTLIDGVLPLLEAGEVSLLIAGIRNDPPDVAFGETRDTIDSLQKRLAGIPRNAVRWLGRREDVPWLMASSDVLVHPARHEGFGLSIAEALAIGLPIVASNVGGIPEVVAGTNAVLIPPNDPIALRQAIQQVLDWSPANIAAAQDKGRDRAEHFRPARRADQLLSFYSSGVENNGAG